jgi:hypothetical protein
LYRTQFTWIEPEPLPLLGCSARTVTQSGDGSLMQLDGRSLFRLTVLLSEKERIMANAAAKTAVEHLASPPLEAENATPTVEPGDTPGIAILAYELWEGRGRPIGDPETDWFEAERLVTVGDN